MLLTLALVVLKLRSLVRQTSHPILELRFLLKFQKSDEAPLCRLVAISHGCPSSSLPGDSNNRALQGMHQVGMGSTNLIVNSGGLSRAVSNIGLCSACLAPLTHRHDLNSRRGLVSDLKWETGHVLDYVVKSKRCVVCARQTLDPESEECAK